METIRSKKIITSTQELYKVVGWNSDGSPNRFSNLFEYPKIPESFIKKYIKEHNDDYVIKEVEVAFDFFNGESDESTGTFEIHIDKNNELTIKESENHKLEKMSKSFDKAMDELKNMSDEEFEKHFPSSKIPKGWVSVEEDLPQMLAVDIMQGYTTYKVKDKNNNEFYSGVSDHNTWLHDAKVLGITHWWNE